MQQQVLNNAPFLGGVNVMPNSVQSILDVFVIQGLITLSDAEKLKSRFRTNREIEGYLVANRVVTRDTINKAYSILLKLPYVTLENVKILPEVVNIIPKKVAEKYGAIAFSRKAGSVLVAVSRPSELSASFSTGLGKLLDDKDLRIELYITGKKDFDQAIKQYNPDSVKKLLLETGSLPTVFLRNYNISGSLLGKFPLDFMENFRVTVFYAKGANDYSVALENPDDPATRGAIQKIAKANKINFQMFATSKEDIDYAISVYKSKISDIGLNKKQVSVSPLVAKPVTKPTYEIPSIRAEKRVSDDDLISISNLFGSFLRRGGERNKETKKVAEIAVTIDDAPPKANRINPASIAPADTAPSKVMTEKPKVTVDKKIKIDSENTEKDRVALSKDEEKFVIKGENNIQLSENKIGEIRSDELKNSEAIDPGNAQDQDMMDNIKIGQLLEKDVSSDEELTKILKENFIPKTVAAIISFALNLRSSDVHIEPSSKTLRIRFRIDGILHDIVLLPLTLHPAIISRIKILSKMKLDETRIPQDGRFDLPFRKREVDVRVSCLPTVNGEKVVMRILDKSQKTLSLENLGMVGRAFNLTVEAIKRPYGIILSTGPTGSGKSTTLYAAISRLSSPSINVITLEDPVEYEIPGVTQCQVKPTIGFTFAEGLRSVLRQDPNVVMVGEIRDGETASMATHAALTGHLVLSTLHTNDAASALPRLTNMGIEPFLITSSIDLVIAQRLVRKICPHCKEESKVPDALIEDIKKELTAISKANVEDLERAQKPLKFYHGTGCNECSKGYRGRVGIFEVIRMTEEIEDLAVNRRPANEIKCAAIKDGMITIKQDGILKAMEGLTTLDEVFQAATS